MFGSLRISKRHISEDARRAHRAAFCASCHALRELGSVKTSLLTNHDQTVLAMLLAALEPERDIEAAPCTALPWRTITVAPLSKPARQLLAAANVAAVEAKLQDDVLDEGGLLPRVGLRFLGKDRSRARVMLAEIGFPVSLFDELGPRQSAVEARGLEGRASLEELAEPSATLCGQMFAHAARLTGRWQDAAAAGRLGGALGRHVYLDDAWRDLDDDGRRGRFNAWRAVSRGAVCPTQVSLRLSRCLATARAALAELELGTRAAPITALLDTLAEKAEAISPDAAGVSLPSREAGDCDLDCCCPCGSCDTDCNVCGAGGDIGAEAAGNTCGPRCGSNNGDGNSSTCAVLVCCPCCDSIECCVDQRQRERRGRRDREPPAHDRDVDLHALIGRVAEAVGALAPEGRVVLDGMQFPARMQAGIAASGDAVRVVEIQMPGTLIVERA